LARVLSTDSTWSTARLMPRRRSIGFMPAATDLQPSFRMARARTVAVVVPARRGVCVCAGGGGGGSAAGRRPQREGDALPHRPATRTAAHAAAAARPLPYPQARTVAGDVVGRGRHLLDQARAHVLKPVLELDCLGHGHAVLGDLGAAVGLLDHHVAALAGDGVRRWGGGWVSGVGGCSVRSGRPRREVLAAPASDERCGSCPKRRAGAAPAAAAPAGRRAGSGSRGGGRRPRGARGARRPPGQAGGPAGAGAARPQPPRGPWRPPRHRPRARPIGRGRRAQAATGAAPVARGLPAGRGARSTPQRGAARRGAARTRTFGPSVTCTASASLLTPPRTASRHSMPKRTSLA
jgi:hypothetical protein